MAESIKIQIANAYEGNPNVKIDVKGRNLLGASEKLTISQADVYPVIHEHAMTIIGAIKEILEGTPPELVGDIYTNGIVMTGGGSFGGLDKLIEKEIGVRVVIAEEPQNCGYWRRKILWLSWCIKSRFSDVVYTPIKFDEKEWRQPFLFCILAWFFPILFFRNFVRRSCHAESYIQKN